MRCLYLYNLTSFNEGNVLLSQFGNIRIINLPIIMSSDVVRQNPFQKQSPPRLHILIAAAKTPDGQCR